MKSDNLSASAAKEYRHERREGSPRKGGAKGPPAWQRYAQPTPVGYGLGMLPPPMTHPATEPYASGTREDAAHRATGGISDVKHLRDAFARITGALRPEESACRALADHLRIDLDCARTLRRIEYHLDALRHTARFEMEMETGQTPGGCASALLRTAQSWWMTHRRGPGTLPAEAVYVARLIRKMMEVKTEAIDGNER
jgi:hypothetical protein